MPIGCEDYKLDIWIHKNVGIKKNTVVCLLETYGKACPICEDRERLLEENGRDYKDKKVKDLSPQRRCYYNVEDDLDLDKGIQILDQSHFKFEKEVYEKAIYLNPGFTKFADLDEGYTIKFRGVKGKFDGREFIEPKDFEFIEREAYDEAVLDEVFPLDKMLNVLTYEEIEKLHYHLEDDDSDDEQEPEQKQERKSKYKKEQEQAREEEIQEEVEDPECPYDHQIGVEHNQTTDCDECLDDNPETFKLCRKLQKDFESSRGRPKEEPKKQQPVKRTPRRNKNR